MSELLYYERYKLKHAYNKFLRERQFHLINEKTLELALRGITEENATLEDMRRLCVLDSFVRARNQFHRCTFITESK